MVKDEPVDLVVVFLFAMEVEPLGIQPGSPNCVVAAAAAVAVDDAVAVDVAVVDAAAVAHVQHELALGRQWHFEVRLTWVVGVLRKTDDDYLDDSNYDYFQRVEVHSVLLVERRTSPEVAQISFVRPFVFVAVPCILTFAQQGSCFETLGS
jgi:hypothetical protein